jgi:hypothetical protein
MLSIAFHLITNTVPCTHNSRWAWHVGQYPILIPVCTEAWHCPQINAMQHASKTVPLNRQHMSAKSEVLYVLDTPEVHTCPCTRTASKARHALPPHAQPAALPTMHATLLNHSPTTVCLNTRHHKHNQCIRTDHRTAPSHTQLAQASQLLCNQSAALYAECKFRQPWTPWQRQWKPSWR